MESGGIDAGVEVVENDVYVMVGFGCGVSEVQFMKNGDQRVVDGNCCESLEKLQLQVMCCTMIVHWSSLACAKAQARILLPVLTGYVSTVVNRAFAPKHAVCVEKLKRIRIVMDLVDNNHFIGLQLNKECPLPPLYRFSFLEKFINNKSKEWVKLYEDNMHLWNALDESIKGPIDSTKGGSIDLNELPPIDLSDG
ncbi:hypothetical protein C5167_033912 [Papaver somniferum]|uniref:Uncharacterized protein n=1 Tax=Papaver somniferum TaxID=3469 RepID=A0A4Y7KF00_PAPSO|nr:hypothetical protein C5167_033912 [Papaver somniferum]